jgi:hypothetical protein
VTVPAGAVKNSDDVENSEVSYSFTTVDGTDIERSVSENIRILPNPASEYIKVYAPKSSTIKIVNSIGVVVAE